MSPCSDRPCPPLALGIPRDDVKTATVRARGAAQPAVRAAERCAVESRRIDGSGRCTVIAIRDRRRRGWVLYPHGESGLGVFLADEGAQTLADRFGDRS